MRVFTDMKTKKTYVEIPTRVPVRMQTYSKTLAYANGSVLWPKRTLKSMHLKMIDRFLQEKPWEHGLKWRTTKSLTATIPGQVGAKEATGWTQINLRMPAEFGNSLEKLAIQQGVSLSSVSYTMVYWWTWWVYPPASERARREAFLRRNG